MFSFDLSAAAASESRRHRRCPGLSLSFIFPKPTTPYNVPFPIPIHPISPSTHSTMFSKSSSRAAQVSYDAAETLRPGRPANSFAIDSSAGRPTATVPNPRREMLVSIGKHRIILQSLTFLATAYATVGSDIFKPTKFGGKYTVTLIPGTSKDWKARIQGVVI